MENSLVRDAHILVVDDDAMCCYATTMLLQSAGYTVISAKDYREVMPVIESDTRLDLLITDIVMPHRVNGFALARMALMKRPQLKVIYLTGFSDLPLQEAEGQVLRKPVSDDALLAAVLRELPPR
jgi:DNA-binding NtrC family response regulator